MAADVIAFDMRPTLISTALHLVLLQPTALELELWRGHLDEQLSVRGVCRVCDRLLMAATEAVHAIATAGTYPPAAYDLAEKILAATAALEARVAWARATSRPPVKARAEARS